MDPLKSNAPDNLSNFKPGDTISFKDDAGQLYNGVITINEKENVYQKIDTSLSGLKKTQIVFVDFGFATQWVKLSKINKIKSDTDLVKEIESKIRKACAESKYTHLCLRVDTAGGMAYVINRAVKMMATDKIKLSTALATLENEFEGVN